jgi:TonB-dependent receptor
MKKTILRSSVSMLALTIAVGAANAQNATNVDIETVISTGARASVANALDIKKNATQAMDSIVSEDIGKLPDTTVVEALQHVTGVAIIRSGYEPSTVLIRGLPDNQTLLNGRQIFTATNRAISLPDFPAEMLARVDVHKASSATDISGGVAGLIDVRLHRPFDFKGFTLVAGGAFGYPTLATVGDPSASVLISDRWQTPIGEIGLLVNVAWRNDHNREEAVTPNQRTILTNNGVVGSTPPGNLDDNLARNPPGNGSSPQRNLAATTPIRQYANGQYGAALWVSDAYQRNGLVERSSLSIASQWKPTQDVEVFLEGFYTRLRNSVEADFFVAQTQNCNNADKTTVFPGTFFANNTTWGCFAINSNQPNKNKEDTGQIATGATWNISPNWQFSSEWSATKSETKSRNNVLDAMYNMPRDAVTATLSPDGSGATHWDYHTTAHQDLNGLYFNQYYDNWNNGHGGAWDGRFDLTYFNETDSPNWDWIKSAAIGYRYNYRNANNEGPSGGGVGCSPTTRGTASSGANFYLVAAYDSPACTAFRNAASINGVSYNSVLAAGGTMAAAQAARTAAHLAVGDPLAFGTTNLLQIGGINLTSVAKDATRMTHGSFFGGEYGLTQWATPNEVWLRRDAEQVRNIMGYSGLPVKSPATSYIVAEGSHDFYGKLEYGFNALGIPVDGNFGVRYVMTRLKQIGANSIYTAQYLDPPTNKIVDQSCLTCVTYVSNTAVKTTYDLMPSINARLTLSDGLFLRLAASKTITRPTFTQTNPAQRVTAATANITGSVTAGNPNLNNVKSYNVDADLSYYWGTGNHLTFAAFHRDVSGYIQNVTDQVVIDGFTYNRTIPVNLVNSKLRGIEAGYSQFLDFLPGIWSHFGWDVNGTFIDGKFNNIRKYQINTAGIYDDGVLSARVSWTWGSMYRESTPVGAQPNTLFVAPRNNVDASVNYNITDQLQIGIDASNIMGSRYRAFAHAAGNDVNREMDVFAATVRRFDRNIAMTVRYRY